MKKVIVIVLFLLFVCTQVRAAVMTYSQAMSSDKPVFILVYATWAQGYQTYLSNFRGIEKEFANDANFVELDITKPETAGFNKKNYIYPNLPYVIMFRNNGMIQRYIDNPCVSQLSCIRSKVSVLLDK